MIFLYWWVLDMGAASSLFMLEFISGEDSIPLSLRSMVALLLLKCCMSVIIFDVFWCNEVTYNCSVRESGNKWIFMCGFELLLGEKRKGGMLQDLKRVVRRTVSKAAEKRQNIRGKTFVVLNYFSSFQLYLLATSLLLFRQSATLHASTQPWDTSVGDFCSLPIH